VLLSSHPHKTDEQAAQSTSSLMSTAQDERRTRRDKTASGNLMFCVYEMLCLHYNSKRKQISLH